MRQELARLKTLKNAEREEFVAKQKDRLFYQNTDEIRKVDQEYKELKNNIERNVQIQEKH